MTVSFAFRCSTPSKFETIQYLLIRAYTANGIKFADEAVEYLCEQPKRLKTGYSNAEGNTNAATFWVSRQLIEVITPHCSKQKLQQLEQVILNFYPDWEKNYHYRRSRGYAQLVLLDAIEPSRRGHLANRRLQEWQRKFTATQRLQKPGKIGEPVSPEAYLVGSPIPQEAIDKMTDEQWLQAITDYDYDDGGSRFERTGELVGGAAQLSELLKEQVRKNPARFSALVLQFPDNTNSYYFNAVLFGLAEPMFDASPKSLIWVLCSCVRPFLLVLFLVIFLRFYVHAILRVCQYCHQLPQKPCGRSIS